MTPHQRRQTGSSHPSNRETLAEVKLAQSTISGCETPGQMPMVCTLGPGENAARIDEWKALLRGVTARHALDGGVRLEFGPDTDIIEIARLAAAEQDCCRFFSFALSMDVHGVALEVHAPPEGQPILIGLFGAAN